MKHEKNYISTTALSKECNKSVKELFEILVTKEFIVRVNDNWALTEIGKTKGGIERNHPTHGKYIAWKRELVLKELNFNKEVTMKSNLEIKHVKPEAKGFREKFKAKIRSVDGHYVRSRAELLIDNWLYMSGIVHAYEKKLPIQEEVYCDFYIPKEKIYIEYWGIEDNEKYIERKNQKIDIYKKYGFRLIELEDSDILNLDDNLPSKLLEFNIQI